LDGIITINERGIVETLNPAAEHIFGYASDEVIGHNINMLMPEPYHSQHDGYLLNYLTTAQARVIGIGREVVGRRKDGSVFPMDLAVSEMSIEGRRMFTGLVRDISERKAMEQMKNEFISTVSHELRTPLTSIQGSLGLILGGATGDLPEKSIKLLTIASNNCKRLVRLINDILDLEKFESGKMVFDIKPIEIMPLITHVIESNQAYAHEFGVTFTVTHEQPGAAVLADSDRLTQVLTNLLSNAAKFSHRGGQVDVAITTTGQRLRISVTDFGAGIQEAFRDRIFKKFTQEDGTNTRQKGGTGLGLSISKAIIEQMGGVIDYESEPGKKTTFFFELPLYRDDKAPLANLSDERNKEHLLILEDDPDVANLLCMMLAKHGYSADIANNAKQAHQMLSSKQYDALTLDLMLPGQSGIDFFRELHPQECFKQLPVIVVSMFVGQGKHALNGDAVNIVDWLSKPIDEDRLEQAVNLALRRNGATSRILHVEDDPDIVHIVDVLLKNTAQIDVAMNLAAAREKLRQDYDLVILDMGLPDGSGETLLPLLANRDKAIPVVIFFRH
jgi:PAS domain S-box-containing protein